MSVSFNSSNYNYQLPQMDPDSYAQKYAQENDITLEEAKEELGSKYGEPEMPQAGGSYDTSIFDSGNSDSETPPDISAMDPDSYAQIYADENGISLDEAKEELGGMFGDPEEPTSTYSFDA